MRRVLYEWLMNRKTVPEMLGEFCREAAVLVLIFALLDKVISSEGLTMRWALCVCAGSAVLLALGILIERVRPVEVE